ncbi:MAG: hypothetical protein QXE12_04215 [Conexivisphaerales archaeon]
MFAEVLKELDTEQSRIIVRTELRKFQKPSTIIQGLRNNREELERLTRELKRRLATGGTVKDGIIILQGDHRDKIRKILVEMGYSADHIEIQ